MKKTNSGFKVHNAAVIAALLAALVFVGSSLAWYFTAAKLDMGSVSGSVSFLANYFESGDGSAEHPYEIARPEQLYNLAWLQYLGAFNQTSDPEFTPFHFYISDRYSSTLDMTGFVLPPIGTRDNPFIGYLDGRNNTVANLTVANVTTENANEAAKIFDLPQNVKYLEGTNVSGVEIIGFMGVVGSYNGTAATYDSQTLALKNVVLQDLTVNTQTDNALIGLAAGYVNGPMENVVVNGGTITIKSGTAPVDATNMTANMSDYSLVGYCTDAYKIMAKQPDEVVQHYILATVPILINKTMNEMVQGSDATWGGSIDMKSMYDRLLDLFGDSTHISYTSAQTVTYLDGVEVGNSETSAYATSPSSASDYYSNTTYDTSTSITYNEAESTDQSNKYMCLDGDRAYEKIITPIYQFTGFKIKSNGYYLNATANGIASGTAANSATAWLYDETNHRIYTYVNNSINPYYLRFDGSTLSVSQSLTTNWYFGDDGCLYYNSANSGNALHCYNGEWMVTAGTSGAVANREYFYIKVGNGNNYYLISNGNNANATLGAKANATKWYGYVDGSSATEYCRVYGTTNSYLRRDSGGRPVYVSTGTSNRYYFRMDGEYLYLYNGSYYVRNNNGSLASTYFTTNRTAITLEYDTETVDFGSKVIDHSETGITQYTGNTISDTSYKTPSTYFPLTVVDQETGDYAVADKNTGYITSGSVDSVGTGDLRVSYFYMSNIFRSMGVTEPTSLSNAFTNYINNANAITYNDTKLQVVTRTANSNGLVRIKDSHNESTIGTRNSRMPATTMTPEELGFKKYDQARNNLQKTFEKSLQDGNRIYGMHYVQAKVDKNRLVTIPHAMINHEEYDNYTVPQDCVDFNLKENGFINFFAGTYYVNRSNTTTLNTTASNNSFFSLHQIFRDDQQNITDILEISKIYKRTSDADGDGSYIYKYTNNKYSKMTLDDQGVAHYTVVDSAASATNANLLFDLDWLTNPLGGNTLTWDSTQYILCAVYYFEIPANEGEYALGSFEGKNGAYLFYLDIAANGRITSDEAWVATTEDVTLTETRTNRFGIPGGVDFGPVSPIGDPDAVASLTGSGSVTYSRNGSVITGTGSGGVTQTVNYLRKENGTNTSYVNSGQTITADSIHLTQYNETDWLDDGHTVPAYDTYGIDHQLIEKHLTVRVYDVGRIDDSFTLAYAYEKDGILEAADDPVLIRYADPLVYMVQYDSSKISAPTIESVGNGFMGTIFVGPLGDETTLTQVYPAGSNKTLKPSTKEAKIQVYGAEELFRVYGEPNETMTCTYSSALNTSTNEQDFTYNVTGTNLEEPIVASDTSGCAVTATSTTAATLTWTLDAPDANGNRSLLLGTKGGLRTTSPNGVKGLQVTDGKGAKGSDWVTVTGKDAKNVLQTDDKGEGSNATKQDEVIRKEEELIIVQNGSRVERSEEEHVTRYYEYFPDAEGSEDGWILVLEVYDEGYKIPIVENPPSEDEEEDEEGVETEDGEESEEGDGEASETDAEDGAEAEDDAEEGNEAGEDSEAGEGSAAGTEAGEETEADDDAQSQAGEEAGAEAGDDAQAQVGEEAGTEAGAETGEGAEAGDDAQVQADEGTEAGAETEAGTKAGDTTQAQAGESTEAGAETVTGSEVNDEAGTEAGEGSETGDESAQTKPIESTVPGEGTEAGAEAEADATEQTQDAGTQEDAATKEDSDEEEYTENPNS